ncbi:MAG: M15 family metallopeptidase [Fimbriimonadaceae bacterium]|nr:M15 family metallopeptidase [Fimbriimonadaceae bacterium]
MLWCVLVLIGGHSEVVVDSSLTRELALAGSSAPRSVLARQALVEVGYVGFDGKPHRGQLVVDRSLAREVRAIFAEIERARFPIARAIPAVAYGWDDLASMRANATTGFNHRPVAGTRVRSAHARGRAIDLNPIQNPHLGRDRLGLTYDPKRPGTVVQGSAVVRAFKSRGWRWGGEWRRSQDTMHFEKP